MSQRFWISIPYEIHLKKSQLWTRTGEEEYFVYRTHWYVNRRQLPERAKVGDIISTFDSPPVSGRKWTLSYEKQWEITNSRECLKQILQQEDTKSVVESEIKGEISLLSVTKTAATLKGALERDLRRSWTATDKILRSSTHSEKTIFSWEYPIPPDSSERFVAASIYKRFAFDVYLVWADYLFVHYHRPSWTSLKKVRFKYPEPPTGDQKPANWIEIRKPKFSVCFWSLMPGSTSVNTESNYVKELDDPFEVQIVPLHDNLSRTDRPDDVPSLYKISNIFPLKLSLNIKKVPRGESLDTEYDDQEQA